MTGGGTGTLKRHIQRAHHSHFVNLSRQTQLSASAYGNEMTTFKYDSELAKREIIRWVTVDRLPLSFLSSYLTSLRREILKIFQEEKSIFCVLHVIGIVNRIFSISFYNASNNNSLVSILRNNFRPVLDVKLLHIRYDYSHVEHVTSTIRDVIKFVRSFGPRRQHFKSLCIEQQVHYKVFEINIIIR
ncbi:hypothetical protein M9H77_03802 [Catharanthus roseus]|uniref:Uncharacterized protein n=1 Tax=Catharanthus roseus TaxID=4058 RepID=A0ACC0CCQ5_CATRO|nr:hypothetical protein M9H77_03802 [Catharanthus roseus]